MWLNFYNIFSPNCTIEFRTWNKTLDPMAMYMAIEVCKAFAQFAIARAYGKNLPLPINSVYHRRSKGDIIETFLSFANEVGLSSHVIAIALELMNKTPTSGLALPREYTYTHLRFHGQGRKDPRHWTQTGYRPDVHIHHSEVRTPEFLDIHNLRSLNAESLRPNIEQNRPQLGRSNSSIPHQWTPTRRTRVDLTLEIPDWVLELNPLQVEELE
jgi:hypothetical protein